MRIVRWLSVVCFAVPVAYACNDAARDAELTGNALLSINRVPDDVRCIRISAAGVSRFEQRHIDAAPGSSVNALLQRLPTGEVTFTGEAFSAACPTVTSSTIATWVSEPVAALVPKTAEPASVLLTLRRNGRAIIGVDFEEDGPPPNVPPNAPNITEPVANTLISPADVHMETGPFQDANVGDQHACTDWEIWTQAPLERVWVTSCIAGLERLHTHLGDGTFENSHAGRRDLLADTDYLFRVRHRDDSGLAASEWSAYAERPFRTAKVVQPTPGGSEWVVSQPGYVVEKVATGFQLPVNLAFVPNPAEDLNRPYFYVTELYGTIKVVRRDFNVQDYATNLLNFNPTGQFPGSGEQGLTGIVVEPASGDVIAAFLYDDPNDSSSNHFPKVVRFHSSNGGLSASGQTTLLDMKGEVQGQSHQISNLSIGPDSKLYVHMGDGFDAATAQNLNSYRGKVLRMNLDGSAPSDNPFFTNDGVTTARDYVFAYGLRNPFGGTFRLSDGAHFAVENGPNVDRFARIARGVNYGWNNSDASMRIEALYNWEPAHAPVNIAFIEPALFSASGFPAATHGHAFVSESGPTFAAGPQTRGKRIVEFAVSADGRSTQPPRTLVEYNGNGRATVVALAAGPDGLYFSDLYAQTSSDDPTARGSNIYRVRYEPDQGCTSAPFGGSRATLPGKIEAEAFDTGAQDCAFSDTTALNEGGTNFRTTAVDIETTIDIGGGHNVGFIAPGEWLKYSVQVSKAGYYDITFRVAAFEAVSGALRLQDETGRELVGSVNVPSTGDWQAWTNVTERGVYLEAGAHEYRLFADAGEWNINYFKVDPALDCSVPRLGSAASVPGIIQVEDYDDGGRGCAYRDTEAVNRGEAYRLSEGVDVQPTTDLGGGHNVGFTRTGEWLKYTVNVVSAGRYDFVFRIATESAVPNAFHLEDAHGNPLTAKLSVPNTGGWQNFADISVKGIVLNPGMQGLRLVVDANAWNINYIRVDAAL